MNFYAHIVGCVLCDTYSFHIGLNRIRKKTKTKYHSLLKMVLKIIVNQNEFESKREKENIYNLPFSKNTGEQAVTETLFQFRDNGGKNSERETRIMQHP